VPKPPAADWPLSRIALPPVEVAEPNVHVPAVVTNAPVGAVIVVPSGDRSVASSADACIVASWAEPALDPSVPPLPQPESPRKSSVARNNPIGILDPTNWRFDMTVTSMMIDYAQETPVY